MSLGLWLKYKWRNDYRSVWQNFHLMTLTDQSKYFNLYRLGLRIVGLGVSWLLGFGFMFLEHQILQFTIFTSWIGYFTIFYILTPYFERQIAYQQISDNELNFLKSLLKLSKVQGEYLRLIYFIEYALFNTFLSELLTIVGASMALKTPVFVTILIAIQGILFHFILLFFFMMVHEIAVFVNVKHFWLRYGIFGLGFVLLVLVIKISSFIAKNIEPFITNNRLHFAGAVKALLLSGQSVVIAVNAWYPGALVIRNAFEPNLVDSFKILVFLLVIVSLSYVLANQVSSYKQRNFVIANQPIFLDRWLLNRFKTVQNTLFYVYLKEMFIGKLGARRRYMLKTLLLMTGMFMMTHSMASLSGKLVFTFITITGLLIWNHKDTYVEQILGFNAPEILLLANVSNFTFLLNKVIAGIIVRYFEVISIVAFVVGLLPSASIILIMITLALIMMLGQLGTQILTSPYLQVLPSNNQCINRDISRIRSRISQLIRLPIMFSMVLALSQFQSLTQPIFLGAIGLFLLISDAIIIVFLMINKYLNLSHRHMILFGVLSLGGAMVLALNQVQLFQNQNGVGLVLVSLYLIRLYSLLWTLSRQGHFPVIMARNLSRKRK
ncbi:hypothetical protein FHQ08_01520 [Lactobacillus sp. CC-MHH1034]|uniref:hypothetical protein n=1 Tax=Agrilactobacillus fermenti TaxID=2586909 RepID=UPI001E5E29DB|nr:hypothetical protein [Agrilactobacillus fermenti]MCD2255389.1 hypothetical protein [Agrilactobacillus fermenti]